MRKAVWALGAATAALATPAQSGGAYCSPEWHPESAAPNCASQIAIAPGNDTRVNLYLLMHDRAGNTGEGKELPDTGWGALYGQNFFKWESLREAWVPRDEERRVYSRQFGTRCQTIESGKAAFLGAMNRNRRLKADDKAALAEMRDRLDGACESGPESWEEAGEGGYFANVRADTIARDPANGYLAYLEGSAAFYSGEWARATSYFTMVAERADDAWLADTASYMQARTLLNVAIQSGTDKWGYLRQDEAEGGAAVFAHKALRDYLSAHPDGQYTKSAQGLLRKANWLSGDTAAQASEYARMLQQSDPESEEAARIVEEADDKYLMRDLASEPDDPLLLATLNLKRMRMWDSDYLADDLLTADELAGQAEAFVDHPELYSFLQANHAFYVAKDRRAVLQLVPDAARADSYTPLAFSRQYLRGLALHALGDRNEEGFWLDLIKGSDGLWQRPSVELALARLYEQQGRLDKVFAGGSPITDANIRRILLGQSADVATLKRVARDETLGNGERSFALYTALLKQLQHGGYRGWLDDYALISQFAEGETTEHSHWDLYDRAVAPVKTFTEGNWSDGYPCPDLQTTVRKLASNPRDIDGRLCLGDFIRLNGFDDYSVGLDHYRSREQEGPAALGSKSFFEGERLHRLDFYQSIIDDRRASANQRAYALYRGVWCYGPSGNNSCGSAVPVETRAAWFRRLKRDYPNSQWAKSLEYYW